MNEEIQTLQEDLRGLRPAGLDPELLDRLEMSVTGQLEALHPELKAAESRLAAHRPAPLPETLGERLVAIARDTPFPVGKKVVLFPGESAARPEKRSKNSWWAAAACVALAGALSAVFVNPEGQKPVTAAKPADGPASVPAAAMSHGDFVPASFDSGVSNASDLGVLWAGPDRPVRVVKVVYTDKVKLLDGKGGEIIATTPRVEYLVVPEKVD